MTILKRLLLLLPIGYLGGLAALLFWRNARSSFQYRKRCERRLMLPAFLKPKNIL